VHMLSLEQYALAVKQARKPGGGQEQIAVVYAEGDISPDVGSVLGGRTIQPEVYVSLLRKLRKDSAVKAVVLRVNSPGGSALSAEQIWREVELTSRVKPVVASFGAVAASGGYFIAAPARYILAEPASITGSIGVFMLLPQVETLMKDKLGIRSEVVGTHRHVDAQTIFRPLDAQEQAVLQQEVEVTYRRFVQHVADGRHMTYARVDSLAEGRVWAAEDALELGLVDTLGGLRDAIVKAATLSGTEKYQVRSYPGNIQSMGDLLSGLMQSVRHESAQEMLGPYYQVWKDLTYLSAPEGVQARLPFHIHLY